MEEREFDELKEKILGAEGKPVCIQALWDGDTTGWFVELSVVLKKSSFFRRSFEELHLTMIRKGGDIRLFRGEIPPWPEAVIAQELGTKLASEFEAEFFFPSPEHPDDDCPNWLDRKKAVNCVSCNKLIIPSWSEHRRRDMCYKCELNSSRENS